MSLASIDPNQLRPLVEEKAWMHGAAGTIGGSVAMGMFYPLDFLRTHMHILHQGSRTPPLRAVTEVVRREGLRGMYRGIGMSVVCYSVGWGLYLGTFHSAQKKVDTIFGTAPSGNHSGRDFLSALLAAVVTGGLVTPLHVLKTRRQLYDGVPRRGYSKGISFSGSLGEAGRAVQQEGYRACFRGLGPQILLTCNTTVQVTLYEWLRRNLFSNVEDPSSSQVAAASAVSKVVACVLFNPLEVVRTRMQDRENQHRRLYSSVGRALYTLWRTEGIHGYYRGLPINVARAIPTTVMAFVLYERCLSVIRVGCVSITWDRCDDSISMGYRDIHDLLYEDINTL